MHSFFRQVGGTKPQLGFRKSVIDSLLSVDVRTSEELPRTSTKSFYHHKTSDLSRLSGQHYLGYIPATSSKTNCTRKCVVCNRQGRRKETRYMCETCNSINLLCAWFRASKYFMKKFAYNSNERTVNKSKQ